MVCLASDNQPDETPEFDFGIDCSDQDMTKYLEYLDTITNLKG